MYGKDVDFWVEADGVDGGVMVSAKSYGEAADKAVKLSLEQGLFATGDTVVFRIRTGAQFQSSKVTRTIT